MAHIRRYFIKNGTESRYQAVVEVGNTEKRKRITKAFKKKKNAEQWINKKLYEKNNVTALLFYQISHFLRS